MIISKAMQKEIDLLKANTDKLPLTDQEHNQMARRPGYLDLRGNQWNH